MKDKIHLVYLPRVSQRTLTHLLQARSQAEARKPGLQHNMGLDAKTLTLLLAKNNGADQPANPRRLLSAFVIHYLKTRSYMIYINSPFLVGFNMIKSLATPLYSISEHIHHPLCMSRPEQVLNVLHGEVLADLVKLSPSPLPTSQNYIPLPCRSRPEHVKMTK